MFYDEDLAHRNFLHFGGKDMSHSSAVYMFSKLSILLFVFPFLTSRNVLYLSVPDLRTSLNCFVSSDSFSSSRAHSRSFPSSSNSTVISASIPTSLSSTGSTMISGISVIASSEQEEEEEETTSARCWTS